MRSEWEIDDFSRNKNNTKFLFQYSQTWFHYQLKLVMHNTDCMHICLVVTELTDRFAVLSRKKKVFKECQIEFAD